MSLIRLIAVPREFDGQEVATMGLLSAGERAVMLYPTPADAANGIVLNSIAIEFTDDPTLPDRDDARRLDGEYVMVRGVFSLDTARYRGLPAGTLRSVKELYGRD